MIDTKKDEPHLEEPDDEGEERADEETDAGMIEAEETRERCDEALAASPNLVNSVAKRYFNTNTPSKEQLVSTESGVRMFFVERNRLPDLNVQADYDATVEAIIRLDTWLQTLTDDIDEFEKSKE